MAKKNNKGLSVSSYPGDGAVLLAFDLEKDMTHDLAGFSIHCITPPGRGPYPTNEYFLPNFLNFKNKITRDTILDSARQTGSDKAPFQLFHWIHYPSAGPGRYQYSVYASYFGKNGELRMGPSVKQIVDLPTSQPNHYNLELGFTRGYISSQAYADIFHNKEIRPKNKSIDFDTSSYQKQYEWLGASARKMVFDFLEECRKDPAIYVDVFSYDFDEPDIIRELSKIGKRVRVFQDDSKLHIGPKAMEPYTINALRKAGAEVKTGHFRRFAHDKIMIQKKKGKAVKVLTGSANFSLRGLYVQANSIVISDDPAIAELYEEAFEQAFTEENKFASSPIAAKWFDLENGKVASRHKNTGRQALALSFAPHKRASVSLQRVSDAVESANSSVFFAVMAPEGGGTVMAALENLANRRKLLSLGTIQMEKQLKLFKRGIDSAVTSFSFLHKQVPDPFRDEWNGGPGQVIHHKFIVCDFNDKSPVVFCGSSNLSAGGEQSNGDNLIGIYDQSVAVCYAVEAIRLFDHYRFRTLQENNPSDNPLILDSTDRWVRPYYDPKDIKFRERQVLTSCAS